MDTNSQPEDAALSDLPESFIPDEQLSIVIPAKNESAGLALVLPTLKRAFPNAEILVVNDGSTDDTAAVGEHHGATVISHDYSMGNGAAIKTGARHASRDVMVMMDGDGQHSADDIPDLLEKIASGYDMVVGARGAKSQAGVGRLVANTFYNRFASWMTGQPVLDLTSGFRAVRRSRFLEFLHLLPNGFSYPTTITMAFFRAGYSVRYVPITAARRLGSSHIRLVHDGVRFLLIIFKIGTLYSPLKIFLPVSVAHFLLGFFYYAYTFLQYGRFTNMSALMFTNAVLIFLIGLVSEQITTLIYSRQQGS